MAASFPKLVLVLGLSFLYGTASGLTLDWDAASWTDGSTTGTINGVDVNVTASTPGLFRPSTISPYPATPAVTRAFDGGLTPGEKTLELSVNMPNGGNANFVTVTLTFNAATYAAGVENVSFSLFDIDYSNGGSSTYRDRIFNFTATTIDGAIITGTTSNLGSGVTLFAGNLYGISGNTDTGPGSGAGNATISFAGTSIRSISFSYSSSNEFADPTYQHVGLHDVNFTPVPEINPAWSALVSCLAAAGLVFRYRANVRKK